MLVNPTDPRSMKNVTIITTDEATGNEKIESYDKDGRLVSMSEGIDGEYSNMSIKRNKDGNPSHVIWIKNILDDNSEVFVHRYTYDHEGRVSLYVEYKLDNIRGEPGKRTEIFRETFDYSDDGDLCHRIGTDLRDPNNSFSEKIKRIKNKR